MTDSEGGGGVNSHNNSSVTDSEGGDRGGGVNLHNNWSVKV